MSTRRERAKAQMKQQPAMEQRPLVLAQKGKNEFQFELGKYCYDLSKLTFAGVVLVNAFHLSEENTTDLVAGASVMVGLLILGMILIKRGTKK